MAGKHGIGVEQSGKVYIWELLMCGWCLKPRDKNEPHKSACRQGGPVWEHLFGSRSVGSCKRPGRGVLKSSEELFANYSRRAF